MYFTAKNRAFDEPTANAVQKLGDNRQHTSMCKLEVDDKENEQHVASMHNDNPYIVNEVISTDCDKFRNEGDSMDNTETPQINCSANASGELDSFQMIDCMAQDETLSDMRLSQNATIDPLLHDSQLRDSFCGTYDSDMVVSQSQGLQLTNTQKVKVFALELDMMKVSASALASHNSLSELLTDMIPTQTSVTDTDNT